MHFWGRTGMDCSLAKAGYGYHLSSYRSFYCISDWFKHDNYFQILTVMQVDLGTKPAVVMEPRSGWPAWKLGEIGGMEKRHPRRTVSSVKKKKDCNRWQMRPTDWGLVPTVLEEWLGKCGGAEDAFYVRSGQYRKYPSYGIQVGGKSEVVWDAWRS